MAVDAASDVSNLATLNIRQDFEVKLRDVDRMSAYFSTAWKRLEKWALQSAATAALAWCHDTPSGDRLAKLSGRVSKCCRVPLGQGVNVNHSAQTGAASYSNLTTCGSVWACPVCAAKISERRRHELKAGLDAATASGARVWLLTLTFPHTAADDLGQLLTRFGKARQSLWGGRLAKDDAESWNLAGHVTALEVTHGANGWHPHAHVLLVLKAGSTVTLSKVKARIQARWERACIRAGLVDQADAEQLAAFRERGMDLRDGKHAASYVSKFGLEDKTGGWDLASEVTKAHLKRGKHKTRTPWDLLRSYLGTGDLDDAYRFVEYVAAFTGKRQLRFSPGLRLFLDLGRQEKTDEELAQEAGEGVCLLASIPLDAWRLVVRTGARGSLLAAASSGDPADVWSYLEKLRKRLAPALPSFRRLEDDFDCAI